MTKNKVKFDILKVKDPSDKIFINKDRIFNIPFKLAIVGKSQISLGKTSIILNLLLRDKYYKKDFKGENIYIVSNNRVDKKLQILKEEKDIPDSNFMGFDEDNIEALYDILEEDFMMDDKDPKLIIFDDVAYSAGLKGTQTGVLSKIVMNGRHINLSSIFTTQKYSLIGTNIRTNLTGVMIGGLNQRELDLCCDDLNFLDDKKKFFKMMRDNTKGRDFVVVNFTDDDLYLNKNFEPIF